MPSREVEDRVARSDASFREANERIARAAGGLVLDEDAVPFICECADLQCFELARLRLDEYRHVRSNPRWFFNVPGHETAARGAATLVEWHDRYLIVEKERHADDVAESLVGEMEAGDGR